jgi:sugar lactone lactonase YvrE
MRIREQVTPVLLLAVLGLPGCGPRDNADTSAQADSAATMAPAVATDSLSIQGFQAPESVLYDEASDVYLVSNINGNPSDHDDNGFISRVSPDGSVQTLKWIDGASDSVVLNAPKGMAVKGDTLFVADIDTVRAFSRTTGAPLAKRGVRGATFLNDLSIGSDGILYVTDSGLKPDFSPSGTAAVYAFEGTTVKALARGDATLHGPNGIVATPEGLVVVPFGDKMVLRIPPGGGAPTTVATLPTGGLDGVVRLADGALLITSWEGKVVYHLDTQGQAHAWVENIESPADIGYDTKRGRILIPQLNQNRVEVRKR